jgi:hypothetical protein
MYYYKCKTNHIEFRGGEHLIPNTVTNQAIYHYLQYTDTDHMIMKLTTNSNKTMYLMMHLFRLQSKSKTSKLVIT